VSIQIGEIGQLANFVQSWEAVETPGTKRLAILREIANFEAILVDL
jgi:hypothetical protein